MKRFYVSVAVMLATVCMQAQETIYELCKNRLEQALRQDEIIKPYSDNKKEQKFTTHIRGVYKDMLPPDSTGLTKQQITLKFEGKSLDKIFRTAYKGNLSTETIDNSDSKELEIPKNSLPIYMINAGSDRFRLNINSSNAMAQALTVKFEGDASIINGRTNTALRNTIQKKSSFDAFYGEFENRIADIMYNLTERNRAPKVNEWSPIYDLMQQYTNNNTFRLNYTSYRLVHRFYGLIIVNRSTKSVSNQTELEANVNINYNYMGLAGINSNYDFEWIKEKSGQSELNTYETYMINNSAFSVKTIELPPISKIKSIWQMEADNFCEVLYPDNKDYFRVNSNMADLSITFGPMALDMTGDMQCKTNHPFIKEVTNKSYLPQNVPGVGRYDMKLKLDAEEISKLRAVGTGETKQEVSVRCGFNIDKPDSMQLSKNYSFNLLLDLKPYAEITTPRVELAAGINIGTKVEYKVPVHYTIVKANSKYTISTPSISNITLTDTALNKLVKITSLKQQSTLKSTGDYEDTLVIITNHNTISADNVLQSLEFKINFSEGSDPFTKNGSVNVVFPITPRTTGEVKPATNNIMAEDVATALYKYLDAEKFDSTKTVTVDGKTYYLAEVIRAYNKKPGIDKIKVNGDVFETTTFTPAVANELFLMGAIEPAGGKRKGILVSSKFAPYAEQ